MWDRSDIRDAGDLESSIVQCPYRRLSAWARTFDIDVQIFDPVILDHLANPVRRHLGSKGCAFA